MTHTGRKGKRRAGRCHHNQARFTWGLGPAHAEPVVIGFGVAVATEDGRLGTVLGFLDQVPA